MATIRGTEALFDTGLLATSAGFRGIPGRQVTANDTCVIGDNGKRIVHSSGGGAGDTQTIDSVANQSWPDGAVLNFVNLDSNAWSIAVTTQTLTLAGTTTTGTRTLAQNGIAVAIYDSTAGGWLISGTGLT